MQDSGDEEEEEGRREEAAAKSTEGDEQDQGAEGEGQARWLRRGRVWGGELATREMCEEREAARSTCARSWSDKKLAKRSCAHRHSAKPPE
jgi:hypothetical protein